MGMMCASKDNGLFCADCDKECDLFLIVATYQ